MKIVILRIFDRFENEDKWELKQGTEDNRGTHRNNIIMMVYLQFYYHFALLIQEIT